MELYVEIKQNKSGEGKHCELKCNLGYRVAILSFDKALCSELVNLSIPQLMSKEVGEKVPIRVK